MFPFGRFAYVCVGVPGFDRLNDDEDGSSM